MKVSKSIIQTALALLGISLFIISCNDKETYPIIPEIKFEDFVLLYNPTSGLIERGVLKISFKDGDGDIGLRQGETDPPFDYNLFITYFEIQNRDTVEVIIVDPVSGDTANFNARIPILTPEGNNKSIKGEIEDTLFVYNPNSDFDTIMYNVYLVDRALHKSNVIQTPLIVRNF
ncbi:MAG: hypothetical protein KDC09_17285 [Bacteroidales bacterium]|nr:hypothetical protein [Bacteroidales bacterium]